MILSTTGSQPDEGLNCVDDMLRSIGREIAKMHIAEIVHGDLTTSNMMIRLTPNSPTPFEIVGPISLCTTDLVYRSLTACQMRVGSHRFRVILCIPHGGRPCRRSLRSRTSIRFDSPGTSKSTTSFREGTGRVRRGDEGEGKEGRVGKDGEEVGRGEDEGQEEEYGRLRATRLWKG